jgi:hypothetical protein
MCIPHAAASVHAGALESKSVDSTPAKATGAHDERAPWSKENARRGACPMTSLQMRVSTATKKLGSVSGISISDDLPQISLKMSERTMGYSSFASP